MAKEVKSHKSLGDKELMKGIKNLPFALQEVCIGMEKMYASGKSSKKEIKAFLEEPYTCKKKHIAELIQEYLTLKQLVYAADEIFADAEKELKKEAKKVKMKANVSCRPSTLTKSKTKTLKKEK